ncbi:hypothetical protein PM03_11930 [Thalassobacter stenotrophicus]|uniref:hypothetical protein n=1 Tax=Thalassobacter TaxID=266808 RepID=UPI00051D11C4|nr:MULTISPECIES: hypothetical protein [Thalassobacter]KGK78710.1 hypothetical protein PM03_11930 [Thalassobacter stenotrophicus]KGL00972.1 hypothetical protein PM04_11470 [Thalassobacter sp. 16PALIMAR09]
MAYHTKNGSEFVGLRVKHGGRMQVVYDAIKGQRLILDIKSKHPKESVIHEALREGIGSKNVLHGVMNALNARSIDVDLAS